MLQRRFLSTLPARGATTHSTATLTRKINFYPRSPRGERQDAVTVTANNHAFLSTLPARGATWTGAPDRAAPCGFLSTLPARGATRRSLDEWRQGSPISIHAPREGSDFSDRLTFGLSRISIHAPREGSDAEPAPHLHRPRHFYPRSPRGERPSVSARAPASRYFYPRSPRGERLSIGAHA